jgi:hypothetical protein
VLDEKEKRNEEEKKNSCSYNNRITIGQFTIIPIEPNGAPPDPVIHPSLAKPRTHRLIWAYLLLSKFDPDSTCEISICVLFNLEVIWKKVLMNGLKRKIHEIRESVFFKSIWRKQE